MRVFVASIVAVLIVLAAIAGSYFLGLHALGHSQAQWCQTLELLTKHPVPKPADPAANPSRETTYQFYQGLVTLKHSFGCR